MENEKDKNLTPEEEKALFSKLEFKYSRSKDDVWAALDKVTSEKSTREEVIPEETKVVSINWRVWSVAASIILILTVGLVARFYTTAIEVAPGEFTSHTLPDGSEVHLNAESSISYNPYWWKMNREVEMEGEAYFIVAKGRKFTVDTELGTTQVLGTEFNVYARGDVFEVYCETGKVKVTNEDESNEVILEPGQFAKVVEEAVTKEVEDVEQGMILSWRIGQFIYNNTPLSKVFEDVQRHYDVTIRVSDKNILKEIYTATIRRDNSITDTLDAIAAAMSLKIEKRNEDTFLIRK